MTRWMPENPRSGKAFVARSLMIRSMALGVAERADVVEFVGDPPRPFPVEYKLGKPKAHRADEVQLCAQAMCLEEMFDISIPEGALFYGESRRRMRVAFDDALRGLTVQTAADARAMIAACRTPPPVHGPKCRQCSLADQCQPECLEHPPSVAKWLAARLAE